jgi:hypothetical protein
MVSTLQDLCYQKIANTMNDAPPLLQEMIIGETREKMKGILLSEIKTEMRKELMKELHLNMIDTIPLLVPEIMTDIIKAMTTHNRMRNDFHNVYPHICPFMIECAVQTAEHAVRNLDDSYIHNTFRRVNNNNNNDEEEYSLDDDDDVSSTLNVSCDDSLFDESDNDDSL